MGLVKVFEAWPDLAYSYKISQHAVNGVWYCNPCCIWDSLCFLYDKLSMLIHCNSFHVRQQKTKKKSERQRKLGPQVCHLTSVQFQCFGTCGFIILHVSSTTLIRHWGKHTCYMSQDSIKIIIFFWGISAYLGRGQKRKNAINAGKRRNRRNRSSSSSSEPEARPSASACSKAVSHGKAPHNMLYTVIKFPMTFFQTSRYVFRSVNLPLAL